MQKEQAETGTESAVYKISSIREDLGGGEGGEGVLSERNWGMK